MAESYWKSTYCLFSAAAASIHARTSHPSRRGTFRSFNGPTAILDQVDSGAGTPLSTSLHPGRHTRVCSGVWVTSTISVVAGNFGIARVDQQRLQGDGQGRVEEAGAQGGAECVTLVLDFLYLSSNTRHSSHRWTKRYNRFKRLRVLWT